MRQAVKSALGVANDCVREIVAEYLLGYDHVSDGWAEIGRTAFGYLLVLAAGMVIWWLVTSPGWPRSESW